MMLFSPAGFEGFIRETSEQVADGAEMTAQAPDEDFDLEALLAIAARYGSEVVE